MNILKHNIVAVVALPLLVAGFFLSVLVSSAAALVVCSGDINNKNIGLEFIADTCMTNTTSTRTYIDTAIQCSNGAVELFAHYGDTWITPGALVGSLLNQGYRVFGDQYGNHVIAVHPNFGSSNDDTIDGKQMSSYAAGQFHANIFEKIFYPPAAIVDTDNDHYT